MILSYYIRSAGYASTHLNTCFAAAIFPALCYMVMLPTEGQHMTIIEYSRHWTNESQTRSMATTT